MIAAKDCKEAAAVVEQIANLKVALALKINARSARANLRDERGNNLPFDFSEAAMRAAPAHRRAELEARLADRRRRAAQLSIALDD